MSTDAMYTAEEVAGWMRCSRGKVTDAATKYGIGANLKGRAGYRFTEADKLALWEAMRPKVVKAAAARRRA